MKLLLRTTSIPHYQPFYETTTQQMCSTWTALVYSRYDLEVWMRLNSCLRIAESFSFVWSLNGLGLLSIVRRWSWSFRLSCLRRSLRVDSWRVWSIVDSWTFWWLGVSLSLLFFHHGNASVTLLFLPPNTTSKIQPMDQGIVMNFKQNYRRLLISKLIDNHDNNTTMTTIPRLPAKKIVSSMLSTSFGS
jgi:hypothetical protein